MHQWYNGWSIAAENIMAKVCLVIIDGMSFDDCVSQCGYLEGSVEAGIARRWAMQACLPTISAALYETIHTGLAPHEHGILGNNHLRQSQHDNIFNTAKQSGKVTAVVAHSYFHTLYGGSDFDPYLHCEINDPNAPIPYARYYSMEGYRTANSCVPSESDLCAQAWALTQLHQPDYLLLHSSSVDTLGHWFTGDSPEYRIQISIVDNALSQLIPRLIDSSYHVMVTADHGINSDGHHGGNQSVLRTVPFYYFGKNTGPDADQTLDQRAIAPTILKLADIAIPQSMQFDSVF